MKSSTTIETGEYASVDDLRIGHKVKPGPDWKWGDQAKGYSYGIIQDKPLTTSGYTTYCTVVWFAEYAENYSFSNVYRVSTRDLEYLEPIDIKLTEAIDKLTIKLKKDGRN